MVRVRTTVVVDEELVAEALRITGATTKRELAEVALRELVARRRRTGILALRGQVLWEGDLETMRGKPLGVDAAE